MSIVSYWTSWTTAELLAILEDDENVTKADIFLSPPDDGNGTEEDSADEDMGDIFIYCIDVTLNNAWQLYRQQAGSEPLDSLSYRRKIVCTYLSKYGNPPSSGGRPKSSLNLQKRAIDQVRYDQKSHWLSAQRYTETKAICYLKKRKKKKKKKCMVHLYMNIVLKNSTLEFIKF